MILLLGASGYLGRAFAAELARRKLPFLGLSRHETDYTRFEVFLELLRRQKPEFVINAAGYAGRPNVDACESARADAIQGCILFPQMLSHACLVTGIPWGHVSSGCIYSGARILDEGRCRTLRDPGCRKMRELYETRPGDLRGFSEEDEPNFTFRQPPCSFYSGSKAMAEEVLQGGDGVYVWRPRLPFDELDHPRNYLSKLLTYPRVYNGLNSISHRGDFAAASLDLWERRAPFGTYNMTNAGWIMASEIVETAGSKLRLDRRFDYWESDAQFYREGVAAPRSNCLLDVSKLLSAGVKMRPVREALAEALDRWVWRGADAAA